MGGGTAAAIPQKEYPSGDGGWGWKEMDKLKWIGWWIEPHSTLTRRNKAAWKRQYGPDDICLTTHKGDLGQTNIMHHLINTVDHTAVTQMVRGYPATWQDES